MEWLVSPESYQQAFEMVCCFFTMIAVFASYLFTMRILIRHNARSFMGFSIRKVNSQRLKTRHWVQEIKQ